MFVYIFAGIANILRALLICVFFFDEGLFFLAADSIWLMLWACTHIHIEMLKLQAQLGLKL